MQLSYTFKLQRHAQKSQQSENRIYYNASIEPNCV